MDRSALLLWDASSIWPSPPLKTHWMTVGPFKENHWHNTIMLDYISIVRFTRCQNMLNCKEWTPSPRPLPICNTWLTRVMHSSHFFVSECLPSLAYHSGELSEMLLAQWRAIRVYRDTPCDFIHNSMNWPQGLQTHSRCWKDNMRMLSTNKISHIPESK